MPLTDFLQGYKAILKDGVSYAARQILEFKGAGVSVADNAITGRTEVTIPGGAGGGSTPAGATGAVQLNSAGALGAHSNFNLAGDVLTVPGLSNIGGHRGSVGTPTAIAATQNDWNPAGLGVKSILRVEATGADRTITGMLAQPSGHMLWIENVGLANIVFQNEGVGSAPENRLSIGGSITVIPKSGALLYYDGTVSRWRILVNAPYFAAVTPAAIAGASSFGTQPYPARADHVHAFPNALPAKGTENFEADLYPTTQQQGTIATAATVNVDVPIATGKRYLITADVWVDNGAAGAVLFAKGLQIVAHQTSGAAVVVTNTTLFDNAGAGFTFTAAANTTNIRFALGNTSGSTRSYNVVIQVQKLDKP